MTSKTYANQSPAPPSTTTLVGRPGVGAPAGRVQLPGVAHRRVPGRDRDGRGRPREAAPRRDEVVAARARVPLGEGARERLAQLARLRSGARPPPAAAARPAADLIRREGVRRPVGQQDFARELLGEVRSKEAESAATNQVAAPPASRSASWAQFTTPRTSSILIPDERVPCISSSGRVRLPLSTRRNSGMRPVRAWTQTTGPFFFAASSFSNKGEMVFSYAWT